MNPNEETISGLRDKVADIKYDTQQVLDRIDSLDAAYQEQTGREETLTKRVQELESKVQGQYDDIVQLERDLTVKTAQAGAWKKEADELRRKVCERFEPTMPVIPKAVAIAIFREGVACGVSSACDELDNDAGITIEETGYTGDFEVSFNRWIDLSEHLDLDWMRDKVGDYDEASVIEALKTLCADNQFTIEGLEEEKPNAD